MRLLIFSVVLIWTGFCGLLVYEGHWITGAFMMLAVMASVNVKVGK